MIDSQTIDIDLSTIPWAPLKVKPNEKTPTSRVRRGQPLALPNRATANLQGWSSIFL